MIVLIHALVLFLAAGPVAAQDQEVHVYLMTMGPGDAVWERFGHNALWIRTANPYNNIAYNWGLFDFNQPGFIRRFLLGKMLYWMGGFDADLTIQAFARQNRSVWAQELNLTAAQKQRLIEFVNWNSQEQNKFYRYDYYRDNCSTRVRDAIDRALGGEIKRQTMNRQSGKTYRSVTRILTENDKPIYTGLELAMGENIDRPISLYEEMFLPMLFRDNIRQVRVRDANGRDAPLVLSEATLFDAHRPPLPSTPPRWIVWYLLLGIIFGGLLLSLAISAMHGSRIARHSYVVIGVLWAALSGVLGCILTFLWLFTDHSVSYRNENLLLVHPLLLAFIVLIPFAAYRARRGASRLAFLCVVLGLLGLVVQVLPGIDQVNGEIIALVLPIHIALLWSASVLTFSGEKPAR